KFDEEIEVGAAGLPVRWVVSGKGWFGAPVKETFAIENGRARWKSLDGGGEADGKDALYLANDRTPYSLEIYLKVLLAKKDHRHRAGGPRAGPPAPGRGGGRRGGPGQKKGAGPRRARGGARPGAAVPPGGQGAAGPLAVARLGARRGPPQGRVRRIVPAR